MGKLRPFVTGVDHRPTLRRAANIYPLHRVTLSLLQQYLNGLIRGYASNTETRSFYPRFSSAPGPIRLKIGLTWFPPIPNRPLPNFDAAC